LRRVLVRSGWVSSELVRLVSSTGALKVKSSSNNATCPTSQCLARAHTCCIARQYPCGPGRCWILPSHGPPVNSSASHCPYTSSPESSTIYMCAPPVREPMADGLVVEMQSGRSLVSTMLGTTYTPPPSPCRQGKGACCGSAAEEGCVAPEDGVDAALLPHHHVPVHPRAVDTGVPVRAEEEEDRHPVQVTGP